MRIPRPTFFESLVLVAIAVFLIALVIPPAASPPPLTDKDLHLENWQPGPEHDAVPQESIRIRDYLLAGKWSDSRRKLRLTISPLGEGSYSISFSSLARCGHDADIQLERTAEYKNGVLILNRPVRERHGPTYRQLFSVRIAGEVRLVPSVRIAEISSESPETSYDGILSCLRDSWSLQEDDSE